VAAERAIGSVPVQFTVPIDGAIGPRPHCGFIEVFREAAVDDGDGAVARAGED
jgi:hypothetical protein